MRIEQPRRARRTYRQRLLASPDEVFPLLCPVREADWLSGWDPEVVYSHSGVAEPGCVFVTHDAGRASIWVVVHHDPAVRRLTMIKTTPGYLVTRLDIALTPGGEGSAGHTVAEVTYEHTALSAEGESFVADFTESYYAAFMKHWEDAMNAYLPGGGIGSETGQGSTAP